MRLSRIVAFLALLGTAIAGRGPAMATAFHVEYSFSAGSSGGIATGGLLALGGKLYGTTGAGGSANCKNGCGTVFSFDPKTGAEVQLYAFAGGADGVDPAPGLIESGGKLYGTTLYGGSSRCSKTGCGTVFSLDLATGVKSLVHTFEGGRDGASPESGLVQFGARLYGATLYGGSVGPCSCGTVYSIEPVSGAEKVVHAFTGADGAHPFSDLIKTGGLLYGTAGGGGSSYCNGNGCGAVFSLDPKTGALATVYAFKGGTDGATPYAGLLAVGDKLYGTTGFGGQSVRRICPNGCGVVYALQPATGAESVVYAFHGGGDALNPRSDLISVDGILYGTTISGAGRRRFAGYGTVFSVDPATGAEALVHRFKGGAEGFFPDGALVKIGRWLYGTTIAGGTEHCGCGTLYEVRP